MNREQNTNAGRKTDLKSRLIIKTLQFENR
jgi:hypothetical protein